MLPFIPCLRDAQKISGCPRFSEGEFCRAMKHERESEWLYFHAGPVLGVEKIKECFMLFMFIQEYLHILI